MIKHRFCRLRRPGLTARDLGRAGGRDLSGTREALAYIYIYIYTYVYIYIHTYTHTPTYIHHKHYIHYVTMDTTI